MFFWALFPVRADANIEYFLHPTSIVAIAVSLTTVRQLPALIPRSFVVLSPNRMLKNFYTMKTKNYITDRASLPRPDNVCQTGESSSEADE